MSADHAHPSRPVTAVVLNLFYTGLGIARSLGQHGVPVIGLTAHRECYGNFSRFVRSIACADSEKEPEALRTQLIQLGRELGRRAVLFPTRDHDLIMLDRFRDELEPYFKLVLPSSDALERCLNKWNTYLCAVDAGVPAPTCWLVEDATGLRKVADEVAYPCVLKPLAAHRWRTANNWEVVGARKAIAVASREQLLKEYQAVSCAERRVLVQQEIPGGDDCLVVAACYIDQKSRFRAGFNAQKLVQTPRGFGTGCVVQTADLPALFDRTIRLLQAMKFTGIAEVEYKWNAADNDYKLIEVNPRPWDQHRLGAACGADLVHLAYCDYAGVSPPEVRVNFTAQKWIAEDAFLMAALRLLWRREPGLHTLLRQARGNKQYAIWSTKDPLPFVVYVGRLIPKLIATGLRAMRRSFATRAAAREKTAVGAVQ